MTRCNKAVNSLHMLEEGIETAALTAVGGPAEQSGIFPQPEAETVRVALFFLPFHRAQSLWIVISRNFY